MSELRRIGDIINPALSKLETSDGARAYGLWARAAGDPVAVNARPRRYARGLLTIECASSVWANELTYLTPQILARMAELEPENPVQRLRFVTAREPFGRAAAKAPKGAARGAARQVSTPPAANPEGRERHRRDAGDRSAEQAARQVGDERLRAAILAALERSAHRAGPPPAAGPDVNHK